MENKTLRDSCLVTKQPCHIPGYAGWCRDMPTKFGGTFGRLTHELLTDRDPDKLILTRMWPQNDGRAERHKIIKERSERGDIIYDNLMIPGYTGVVPTLFDKHGRNYREACNDAISDFEHQQRREDWKHVTPQNTKYKLPRLKKVCPEADAFYSKDLVPPPISPYYMRNGHPLRHFVSGYGGFVPQRRYMIGSPYPIETSHALKSFDELQGSHAFNAGRDVNPQDNYTKHPESVSKIYRESSGLIPRYTGHVPGYIGRFGQTFGVATRNALGQCGITQ